MILENAAWGIRGQLTRWMLEVAAGVFVGKLSRRVREELWTAVSASNKTGRCLVAFPARNEQGFAVLVKGDAKREIFDNEGLQLVRLLKSE